MVATSSAEAEYVSVYCLAKQMVEVRHIAQYITGVEHDVVPVVFCDNGSTIAIANSAINTKGVRHIELRYHFVRQELRNGRLVLKWAPTKEQVADALAKPTSRSALMRLLTGDTRRGR